MNEELKHSITRLNEISVSILNELKAEEPRLDFIQNGFEERKEYLKVLGTFENKNRNENTDRKELGLLRPLFDAFLSMNEEIKRIMATLKDQQFEKLARAKKQRKVQESYVVSRTPNISHF